MFHAPPERDGADVEGPGGLLAVAVELLESANDERPFVGFPIQGPGQREGRRGDDLGWQVPAANGRAAGEDHRALDGVFELANVPGPGVVDQCRHGVGRQPRDVLLDAL